MHDPVQFASALAQEFSSEFGETLPDQVTQAAKNDANTRDLWTTIDVGGQIAGIAGLFWEISKFIWARWPVIKDSDRIEDDTKTHIADQKVLSDDQLISIIKKAIEKARASDP